MSSLAEGVRGHAELSLLFVGEDDIAILNEEFLGQAGPTDVLAFPIDGELVEVDDGAGPHRRGPDRPPPDPGDLPLLLGDVVVCPGVAARQADTHAGTVDDELALLVVHGVLHVLGHDHAEPAEHARMRAREMELLQELALERARARRLPAGPARMIAVELTSTDVWMLVAIVLLLLVLGFLAMAETALNRISKVKAQAMAESSGCALGSLPGPVGQPARSASSTRSW